MRAEAAGLVKGGEGLPCPDCGALDMHRFDFMPIPVLMCVVCGSTWKFDGRAQVANFDLGKTDAP